jgi:hypothetical protein
MERSVIRDRPLPDYAALHPGYKSGGEVKRPAQIRSYAAMT